VDPRAGLEKTLGEKSFCPAGDRSSIARSYKTCEWRYKIYLPILGNTNSPVILLASIGATQSKSLKTAGANMNKNVVEVKEK
jgi:hypothetical protein